jgi:hypothetical protein
MVRKIGEKIERRESRKLEKQRPNSGVGGTARFRSKIEPRAATPLGT